MIINKLPKSSVKELNIRDKIFPKLMFPSWTFKVSTRSTDKYRDNDPIIDPMLVS